MRESDQRSRGTNRRGFMGAAAMMMGAAHFGVLDAAADQSRELTTLDRASEWLNSPRLTAASLMGKVVVINFCTYTCINWLRTLPYVRGWAQKYKSQLVVIGIHTPEFAFERKGENVRRAVRQLKIEHPIVIDNDYLLWHAFSNQYWPALYFIDWRGRVRDQHFGEGEYERSEKIIRRLIQEAGGTAVPNDPIAMDASGVEAPADWSNLRSGENYLGFDRTQQFASPGGAKLDERRPYATPTRLTLNQWSLAGEWTVGRQAIGLSSANGSIACRFHARDVHLVMGPSTEGKAVRFKLSLDGKPPGEAHGLDVDEHGNGSVIDQRLYQLVRQGQTIVDRTLRIDFADAGVEAFAFTFG